MAQLLKDVNHIHPLEDYVDGGIEMLPEEFLRDKHNFVELLKVYLERWEKVDQMMVQLAEMRLLKNAAGGNLDEIGRQMGIFRNGLDDTDYRAVLMILMRSSNTSGTRTELINTLNRLFGEGNFYTYKGDNYRFDINIQEACFDVKNILQELLDMLPMPTHLRDRKSVV